MVIFNLGGIVGSLAFGTLSERIGRRRTLMLASLLSRRTAFCVIPAYRNELSPAENRATFPGFVYQLGNLLASVSANVQSEYAASHGHDYATAIAVAATGSAL